MVRYSRGFNQSPIGTFWDTLFGLCAVLYSITEALFCQFDKIQCDANFFDILQKLCGGAVIEVLMKLSVGIGVLLGLVYLCETNNLASE